VAGEPVSVDVAGLVEAAWREALAADRPFVIGFRTDPAVIPPHATREQAEAVVSAIVKGDSDRGGMIRQGIKAKVQEFLPGRRQEGNGPGAQGKR